jgi:hypothetical protein
VNLGDITTRLIADTTGWGKNLTQAQKDLQQVGASSVLAGNLATQAFEKIGTAIVSVVSYMADASIQAGRWAEQMGFLAAQTGLSENFLISMQPALNRVGLTTQDLAMGFRRLASNVKESADTSSAAGMLFERLGIDIAKLKKDPEAALIAISEAVKKMPPGFERSAEVAQLLGPRLMKLLPLLLEGAEGFKKSADEATKMGLAMSGPTREALKEMNNAVADADTAAENFTRHLGAASATHMSLYQKMKKSVLDWATTVVDSSSIAIDVFATELLHLGMIAQQVSAVVFSTDIFSGAAWSKAIANIQQIREASILQVAKLKGLDQATNEAEAARKKLNQAEEDAAKTAARLTEEQQKLREAMKPVALKALDVELAANTAQWDAWEKRTKSNIESLGAAWTQKVAKGSASETELAEKQIEFARMTAAAEKESIQQKIAANIQFTTAKRRELEKQATNTPGKVALATFDLDATKASVDLQRASAEAEIRGNTAVAQSTTNLVNVKTGAAAKMIAFANESITASTEANNAAIAQNDDLQTAYEATAAASQKLEVQTGTMTAVQDAAATGTAVENSIQRKIAVTRQYAAEQEDSSRRQILLANVEMINGATTQSRKEELTNILIKLDEARAAARGKTAAQIALFEEQIRQAILNTAATTQAAMDAERRANLDATTSIIGSKLDMAKASQSFFDDDQVLRDLRYEQIHAQATRELDNQNLTQTQITAIHKREAAARMGVAKEFPTFYQTQLQALVASNAFSMAQISSAFTGAVATMIVKGGNLQQFFEQLQITLLQSLMQVAIQMVATWLLTESTKTAITAAQESSRTAMVVAGNTARLTTETVTATGSVGIWGAASTAIVGMYAGVASGFAAIGGALIGVLTAVGTFVMGVLTAIGTALTATVFGIPWAGAIFAGVILIGLALSAATGLVELAEGGIVKSPTMALIGEKGPEAVIPLDQLGKQGSAPTEQTIIVELDGRAIARSVTKQLFPMLRIQGVNA